MVASDDAEEAMEIVQTPGCSSNDTMAAYKVQ